MTTHKIDLEQQLILQHSEFNNTLPWFKSYIYFLRKNIAPSYFNKYQAPILPNSMQITILDLLNNNFATYSNKNYNGIFWQRLDEALCGLSRKRQLDHIVVEKLCSLFDKIVTLKKNSSIRFITPLLKNNSLDEKILLDTILKNKQYTLLTHMASRKTLSWDLQKAVIDYGKTNALCLLAKNSGITDPNFIQSLLDHKSNAVKRNIFMHYNIPTGVMAKYYMKTTNANLAKKNVGEKLMNTPIGKEIAGDFSFLNLKTNKNTKKVKELLMKKIAQKIIDDSSFHASLNQQ